MLLALLASHSAAAQPTQPDVPPALGVPHTDDTLRGLIAETLRVRPELQGAEQETRAERERVGPAGALPDPLLSVSIQNDGFRQLQIGKMETSYYAIELTQPLPWPGKRRLREDIAQLSVATMQPAIERARLGAEAAVRRAYLDLLLTRERIALSAELASLLETAAVAARSRYEAGTGAQSDVLRAQLELSRLRRRTWVLEGEEQKLLQGLNRLRGHALDEAIATEARVSTLTVPHLAPLEEAWSQVAARAPEVTAARVRDTRAKRQIELAERERFPDLAVSAGVMPRGSLEPMWRAGLSIGLPVWSRRKQLPVVHESHARKAAAHFAVAEIEDLLRLRLAERRTALHTLTRTLELYRAGLLVQSEATAEATLAQYRVGAVPFTAVLDASAGYLADEEEYLLTLADAQRVAIAEAELSLEPLSLGAGADTVPKSAMPAAGAGPSAPTTPAPSAAPSM